MHPAAGATVRHRNDTAADASTATAVHGESPPMPQSDSKSLTQDTVYDLLSNARRRFVLSYLRDRDEPVKLSDLSKEVAAWENETSVDDLTPQQTKRVYVSLYQTHIPKLDESGLVEYDRDSGDVQLTSNVAALDSYLPERDSRRIPWPRVYTAIAAAGLAIYAGVLLLPAVFSWVSMTLLNVLIVGVFGIVAVAHYWTQTRG